MIVFEGFIDRGDTDTGEQIIGAPVTVAIFPEGGEQPWNKDGGSAWQAFEELCIGVMIKERFYLFLEGVDTQKSGFERSWLISL